MTEPNPASNSTEDAVVALLCLSDASAETNVAMAPVFGSPFVHHLIKTLERSGVKRIFIGTDAVSARILSYCDEAKQSGLDVQLLRRPADLAALIKPNSLVLVQSADIVWDSKLLQKAVGERRPLVAAVEERTENEEYERIDLNNRWAGLAMLEQRSIAAMQQLPDGWDIASSLLRQALQDGLPLWQVRQKEVEAGAVKKLLNHADAVILASSLLTPSPSKVVSLEALLLRPVMKRILPHCWSVPWTRIVTEWAFPTTAAAAMACAYLSLPFPAILLAVMSIFSGLLRKTVHRFEYRDEQFDWAALIGWTALAASLMLVLYQGFETIGEAVFLTAVVAILSNLASPDEAEKRIWVMSPLSCSLIVLCGEAAGLVGWSIRILIVAQLVFLLWALVKIRQKSRQA